MGSFDHFQAMVAVRELRDVRGPARAVLYALIARADGSGINRASIAQLAADAGCRESAAKAAIRLVEASCLVEIKRYEGERSVYRLTLPGCTAPPPVAWELRGIVPGGAHHA